MTGPVLARAREFQRETIARLADEVRDIEEGWIVRSRALPLMWTLNHVRVRTAITFDHVLELADRHFAGTSFRHVVIEDDRTGERLAESFRAAGWEVDAELNMVLLGDPDREVESAAVAEAGEEEALELMRRWNLEDPPVRLTKEAMRQILEYLRLTWRARGARRLGVHHDGRLAAVAMLFSDGSTAQVEDVYALPDARGNGFGRMLVTHAARLAREAGHELTFIVADDSGWPKHLYARVGFKAVGRSWLFHRELQTPSGPGLAPATLPRACLPPAS